MNFTWICYLSGESVDINDVSSLQEVYPDGSQATLDGAPVAPAQAGGCFNTGPGRIKVPLGSHTVMFNNSLMLVGNTYYIVLRVTKDQRVGTYTQRITVAEAPPPFNIRYEVLGKYFLTTHHILDSKLYPIGICFKCTMKVDKGEKFNRPCRSFLLKYF